MGDQVSGINSRDLNLRLDCFPQLDLYHLAPWSLGHIVIHCISQPFLLFTYVSSFSFYISHLVVAMHAILQCHLHVLK